MQLCIAIVQRQLQRLRQRINQYLAKDRRVAEKRLGKWGEGDTGVTVVRLSKKE